MIVKTMLQKIGLMFLFILFFAVLVYFVLQRGETIKREAVPTMETEYVVIEENKDKIIGIIREIINKNKNLINARTCRGFLYDGDKDGRYDKTILDQNVDSLRKDLVIKYNFCSYTTSKENHFLVIFSTTRLINDFMKKEMGDDYVPALVVNVDNKGVSSKEALISSEILLEGL